MHDGHTRWLDWAVAERPMPGQAECGDVAVFARSPGGALLAAVDGLGHGPEAAKAARKAAEVLRQFSGGPLGSLLERCHETLKDTRGAVLGLAALRPRERSLTWMGVGSVQGRLFRFRSQGRRSVESMVVQPGIVGERLPPPSPVTIRLEPGDTLVLATDGIGRAFANSPVPSGRPRDIADALLAEYRKETDDALVLVARYMGRS